MLAYFVRSDWQLLAGGRAGLLADEGGVAGGGGEPYAWHAVVGLVMNSAVVWLLLRRFNTVLHR